MVSVALSSWVMFACVWRILLIAVRTSRAALVSG